MRILLFNVCAWLLFPLLFWSSVFLLCTSCSASIVVGSFNYSDAHSGDDLPSHWVAHYDATTGDVDTVSLNWSYGHNRGFCMYEGGGTIDDRTGDLDVTFRGIAGEVTPCMRPDRIRPEWIGDELRVVRTGADFYGTWSKSNGTTVPLDLRTEWELYDATPGDADRNGVFDSADLVEVFAGGRYEKPNDFDLLWQHGDWNLDGRFDSSDMVTAFTAGGYQSAAVAVPEPCAGILMIVGLLAIASRKAVTQ